MYPILFSLGQVNFYSYGLMAALSFIFGFWATYTLAKKKALPVGDLLEKVLLIFFFSMVFGHLSYFFLYRQQFSHWYEVFYLWRGLTSFGGILGGFLAIVLFFRKNLWTWLDILSIAFLIGVFFWRTGCFLTGDHPTVSQPLWMTINNAVPVPLFESLLALVGAAVAYLIYRKNTLKQGYLFWLVIGYYGLLRLIIDSWRIDEVIWGLRIGQLIGLVLVITAIIVIILMKTKVFKNPKS